MSKKDLNIKEFLNIRLVLDRSGSMASCKEITIDSINSFLEEQRKNNVDGALTISLFDNRSIDVPINSLPIRKVEKLNYDFLQPRGSTPLLDAIGLAINELDNHRIKENEKKVLVIVTDGLENASREYDSKAVKTLIEEKTEQGWLIIYLGADHDAILQSERFGFQYEKSLHYSKEDSIDAFKSVSRTVDDFSKGTNSKLIRFYENERMLSNKKMFRRQEEE